MNRSYRTRSVWYAVTGAILSLGAPAGLLILRELYARRPLILELSSDRLTYVYIFITTAIVLASLGFILGRQADKLAALSETDVLTGLPNRRALTHRLTAEFRRSLRYGTPVSLMLIDVDGLKQVNDRDGHAAGDRVIRHVGDTIHQSLRESDFGARWGGDEFGVVAPNTTADAARSSAERLVASVARITQGRNGLRTAESQELLNLHCERGLPREGEDDAAMGRGRAVRPAFQIAPSAFILKL